MSAVNTPTAPSQRNLENNQTIQATHRSKALLVIVHLEYKASTDLVFFGNREYPSKDIHLRQLQDIDNRLPEICSCSGEYGVDQGLLDLDDSLFVQVYNASLMHAFYRPSDPNRTVCLLMSHTEEYPSVWRQKPGADAPLPTHVLGLIYHSKEEFSLLLWGTCKLVGKSQLEIKFTCYDSKAQFRSMELMDPYLDTLWDIVESSLPSGYDIIRQPPFEPAWSDDSLNMSERQLTMAFCQLISTVVHDLPFNHHVLKKGPLVQPIWPSKLVETQIRALLGQISEGKLRLQSLTTGAGSVPECIYLHG